MLLFIKKNKAFNFLSIFIKYLISNANTYVNFYLLRKVVTKLFYFFIHISIGEFKWHLAFFLLSSYDNIFIIN